MSTKELLRALTAVTQSYTDEMKKFEATRKRIGRAECKIRDLTVEIRHMADLIDQFRLENQMEYVNSPQYSPNPPEYELVSTTSPESPATH